MFIQHIVHLLGVSQLQIVASTNFGATQTNGLHMFQVRLSDGTVVKSKLLSNLDVSKCVHADVILPV